MKLQLIQGPEGSPNSCFGTENEAGESVDFVQYDWGCPDLVNKLGGELPDPDEVGREAYLVAAFNWLEQHDGEEFDVADDAEVIDA